VTDCGVADSPIQTNVPPYRKKEHAHRQPFPCHCVYTMANSGKTFVVEHLDPELEAWSSLEYRTIASESHATGAQFLLSSVPTSLKLPENLQNAQGLNVETRGIEEIYADKKDRVCLLDPAASKDLSPEDGDTFDIFLFGGILGRCISMTAHLSVD
jgi:ribosome biogenesis SPOUT family RNA methylase Rps3